MKLASNAILLLTAGWIVQQASVGAVELEPTFQNEHASKNIAFFAPFGGSSHISWVLSIGNELAMRGHNFTFLTVVSSGTHIILYIDPLLTAFLRIITLD